MTSASARKESRRDSTTSRNSSARRQRPAESVDRGAVWFASPPRDVTRFHPIRGPARCSSEDSWRATVKGSANVAEIVATRVIREVTAASDAS
jgi:hypothetical protein